MSLEARWFAYFPSVRSLTSCYVLTMFKTDMWGMFEQSTMLIFEERENPQLNCILQTIVSQFCPNFIQVLFSPSLNCQTSLTCLSMLWPLLCPGTSFLTPRTGCGGRTGTPTREHSACVPGWTSTETSATSGVTRSEVEIPDWFFHTFTFALVFVIFFVIFPTYYHFSVSV